MPESKNVLDRDAAGIILINALSIPEGLIEKLVDQGDSSTYKPPVVEVQLFVNGQEVPFVQAVNEAFAEWERNFDDYVTKKAKKLLTEIHLDEIEQSLQSLRSTVELHEWDIKDKLQAAISK